jgi:nitrous oxidase accessory protein NosD
MKRRAVVLLGLALAAVGLSMGPARAAGVLVVDDDYPRSCAGRAADHATIQAAVDDARPGGRIRVCPGTYEETVEVPADLRGLTIEGAKAGIDARRRRQTGESIVTALSADGIVRLLAGHVVWDGFLVLGQFGGGPGIFTSPHAAGYVIRNTVFLDNGMGLHLNASGKALTRVRHNRFTKNNEFEGPGAGNGIYADQGTRCVLIADNLFEGHNGAGILFARGGRCVTVERNKSIRDRSFATFYGSSHVRLAHNFVRGRGVDDPAGSAIFIGAGNDGVVVKRNHVEAAAGNGIDIRDTGLDGTPPRNVDVLKNKVREGSQHGIDVAAAGVGEYQVRGNLALHNGLAGLHADPNTHDVAFAHNLARRNGTFDCHDESSGDGTADTDNTWRRNVGGTADPDGICHPHLDKPKPKHKHKGKGKHRYKHKPKPKPCYPWRN